MVWVVLIRTTISPKFILVYLAPICCFSWQVLMMMFLDWYKKTLVLHVLQVAAEEYFSEYIWLAQESQRHPMFEVNMPVQIH